MDVSVGDEVLSDVDLLNLNLSELNFKRTLCSSNKKKFICIEGSFSSKEGIIVSFFEKPHLSYSTINDICCANSTLQKLSSTGIFSNFQCFPSQYVNEMKMMLIFPATKKHIQKYESCPIHIIRETPELYRYVVLPYITKESFNLQWVYNIFDHIAEKESIIYEDVNPKTGFLLASDFKWDKKNVENLHVLALVRPRNIKSLRDLDSQHLPLLRNIYNKGIEIIQQLYGLGKNQLRIYFHYQPSYYHLHVHFTNIEYQAPGINVGKAHPVESVVKNIELIPDYYKRATLSYVLKETDGLYKLIRENENDCDVIS